MYAQGAQGLSAYDRHDHDLCLRRSVARERELSSRMGISPHTCHSVIPIPTAALVIMDSVSTVHKGKGPLAFRLRVARHGA